MGKRKKKESEQYPADTPMTVAFHQGVVTVTMNPSQFGILRYAYFEAVMKLKSTASYLRIMKEKEEAKSAKDTADRAEAFHTCLETASKNAKHS